MTADLQLRAGSSLYLSPEPLLQEPLWVADQAHQGFSTPTYAYALSNPVRYLDVTGLDPGDKFKTTDEAATDVLRWLRKKYGKSLRKNEWCGQIRKTSDGQCVADKPWSGPTIKPGAKTAQCNTGKATEQSLADFHTHPWTSTFSDPDKDTNDTLMYPGYLLGPDGQISRYDPKIVPGTIPLVLEKRKGAITPLVNVGAYP